MPELIFNVFAIVFWLKLLEHTTAFFVYVATLESRVLDVLKYRRRLLVYSKKLSLFSGANTVKTILPIFGQLYLFARTPCYVWYWLEFNSKLGVNSIKLSMSNCSQHTISNDMSLDVQMSVFEWTSLFLFPPRFELDFHLNM